MSDIDYKRLAQEIVAEQNKESLVRWRMRYARLQA